MSNKPSLILVVEDDPDISAIVQFLLRDAGFDVQALDQVTLSQILSINPSLILMDHWLKPQLGADMCKELKRDKRTEHIPVILCSAVNNLPTIQAQCQADAFLAKPFDLETFMQTVRSLVPTVSQAGEVAD